ncbi:hypothetical protein ACGYK6_06600 [Sulfitobacter sp. 1A15333]|jgi:hypothetical protein|uniref:Uncharacterized protein n=1 Tax=Sulfitobacter faviae TaxID=1775881 RepID=A0AAX3LT50_9RHOB|nr:MULTISPECIES: hypothetical protein [Sulfitobacter]WCE71720.1 hypothetical protein PL336_07790 [Sulfitobacter faviae]|tara:strand:- start:369 stop:608 length:240 start_codon:yes stop_codon:yes gene_type:complete
MESANTSIFDLMVWGGAGLSLLGLLGLGWCIIKVSRAKRAQLDDEAMRVVLRKVVPLNMGALFLSVIGLMLVILGISLG